jgi:hypothetical protein
MLLVSKGGRPTSMVYLCILAAGAGRSVQYTADAPRVDLEAVAVGSVENLGRNVVRGAAESPVGEHGANLNVILSRRTANI